MRARICARARAFLLLGRLEVRCARLHRMRTCSRTRGGGLRKKREPSALDDVMTPVGKRVTLNADLPASTIAAPTSCEPCRQANGYATSLRSLRASPRRVSKVIDGKLARRGARATLDRGCP
jgi:hypothetical protein